MSVRFKGAAKRMDKADPARVGKMIGVGEDEIRAVLEVEAAGSGFDRSGRVKMLFEPHIFYRELGPGSKREMAVRAGLAYPNWKRSYPPDSYPRLLDAMEIDETAAVRSASWGLPQILGRNHAMAGYATPQAMVSAFADDEENHLVAMVNFIKAAGLADDLSRHDWHGFARGYNGAQYAVHNYHGRLAAAYRKWSKKPDASVVWADEPEPPKSMHYARSDEIREVQRQLRDLGYYEVGSIDGLWGGKTKGAIAAFMNDRDLSGEATIDDRLHAELEVAFKTGWRRPVAPERSDATEQEVERRAPELKPVTRSRAAAFWSSITAAVAAGVNGVATYLGDGLAFVQQARAILDDVPGWVWLLLAAAVAAGIGVAASRGASGIVAAFRRGERN